MTIIIVDSKSIIKYPEILFLGNGVRFIVSNTTYSILKKSDTIKRYLHKALMGNYFDVCNHVVIDELTINDVNTNEIEKNEMIEVAKILLKSNPLNDIRLISQLNWPDSTLIEFDVLNNEELEKLLNNNTLTASTRYEARAKAIHKKSLTDYRITLTIVSIIYIPLVFILIYPDKVI